MITFHAILLKNKIYFKHNLCIKLKYILCVHHSFPENRAVYEIMWKKILWNSTGNI